MAYGKDHFRGRRYSSALKNTACFCWDQVPAPTSGSLQLPVPALPVDLKSSGLMAAHEIMQVHLILVGLSSRLCPTVSYLTWYKRAVWPFSSHSPLILHLFFSTFLFLSPHVHMFLTYRTLPFFLLSCSVPLCPLSFLHRLPMPPNKLHFILNL